MVFLTGLIFFARLLILKKNMGCGLLGLFIMIIIALVFFFRSEIISYQSEDTFIIQFENATKLSYPASGRIVEKRNNEFLNFSGDYESAAIIKMDSLDYKKILQNVQSDKSFEIDSIMQNEQTTPSFLLKKQLSVNDFDYVYKKISRYKCSLWFHKNKQIIVYEDINY
jgi:hypothetical protein